MFMNEAFENSVGTQRTDMGMFKKFALNLTTVALPNLIANDLVIVHPMSSMSGYVTYIEYQYADGRYSDTYVVRKKSQYRTHRQGEKREIYHSFFRIRFIFRIVRNLCRFSFYHKTTSDYKDERRQKRRRHNFQKFRYGYFVVREQKQVLRIAERGQQDRKSVV